ncbi:MAG: hybrid sensor histidine kinase/response regulator, partial [Verrucomicrobia bacterium]
MSAQSMSPLLRILHLEDNPTDAELVRGMLEAAGVDCAIRRVETREAFQSALEREQFDLVISDFTLPSFDGLSALTICRHKKPELPFIFVSGTIGEDAAVESLKRGATDYVIKDRLSRLATSVERAVQEAQSQAERLQADEKIREQAALLDKARDAICVMDMEFTILYWNRGAERLYGWSVEEAVGQSAHDLLFRGNVSLLLETVKQLIRQNEWQGELHKNSKDGRENVVESRWTLLRDALGRPKSILLIDSDITEKKQIEAQLFRTQRVQSIGAVAGGIAHDLNNMLAPILMVTELLRDELASEQSRKMLDTAKASAQRGAEMVKQILAFARGAGGEPKTIQLKHLVNEMVRLIGDTFPRSIQVESRVDKELYPILGDAAQFNQVLLNLCVNARDAMPGGGRLQVGADNAVLEGKRTPMFPEPVSGKFVVLSVVDTGCGIPPELAGRIFEPFFTTKEPGKGTGLGLSTVLTIVKAHHGFVEVV